MRYLITHAQIAAFRLKRHHLLGRQVGDLVEVCRKVCGLQAQLMPSAEIAAWTRIAKLKRIQINAALWQQKSLVRTSCMRQTLHLIPADEFWIYIDALRESRFGALWRIMLKFGVTKKELDGLNRVILDALSTGPLTQQEVVKEIRGAAGKNIRAWMERFFSPLRPAVVEGLVCYGPDIGRRSGFVRVDQWLPSRKRVSEIESKRTLLRRYLQAYGPAKVQDFSRWAGMSIQEAAPVWKSLEREITEVPLADGNASILQRDREDLQSSGFARPVLNLLPSFDPFLLGHAGKDHLIEKIHYKRVYRDQWWISPVVLWNGKVIGLWSYTKGGRRWRLRVEFFKKASATIRNRVNDEAESLSKFVGNPIDVTIK